MPICEYFSLTKKTNVSKTTRGRGTYVSTHDVKKCTHPESSHKPNTLTENVMCEGDQSKCVIPPEKRGF